MTMTGLLSFFSHDISIDIKTAKNQQLSTRTVHTSEKLGNYPPLHLSLRTFSLWGDSINLVDEEKAGCVALGYRMSV